MRDPENPERRQGSSRPLIHGDMLLIAGTRPEALKLLPVAAAWPGHLRCCWTGQQQYLPEEAAALPWQRLPALAHPLRRRDLEHSLATALIAFMRRQRPAAVLVQGDTASAFAGAKAANALGLAVIHLEAGLRSGSLRSPFPEEAYRRAIARLADLHLAPSRRAAAQLALEGIAAEAIAVVGSTAVDGLPAPSPRPLLRSGELLVDVHRRENAGRSLDQLASALRALARRGWSVALAAHPNQYWECRWTQALGEQHGVQRLQPMDRKAWLARAGAARAVLSDSGGASEELPYLGVPLLLYRRHSERTEALESGHARWLPPQARGDLDLRIERAVTAEHWPEAWTRAPDSPYGDGLAGVRAAAAIAQWWGRHRPAPSVFAQLAPA